MISFARSSGLSNKEVYRSQLSSATGMSASPLTTSLIAWVHGRLNIDKDVTLDQDARVGADFEGVSSVICPQIVVSTDRGISERDCL